MGNFTKLAIEGPEMKLVDFGQVVFIYV